MVFDPVNNALVELTPVGEGMVRVALPLDAKLYVAPEMVWVRVADAV
jgi:hypothetical protein